MSPREEIAILHRRIEEIEDVIVEMDSRLKDSERMTRILSILGITVTLIVGVLQAAATWYHP